MTPDVETMWQRYEGYLNSNEPLPAMAYFCLTVLEAKAGNPDKAAKAYRISKRVLGRLAELTSQHGDEKTARKMPNSPRALTEGEIAWIEVAVTGIIRRLAEHGSGIPLAEFTMNDLPPL